MKYTLIHIWIFIITFGLYPRNICHAQSFCKAGFGIQCKQMSLQNRHNINSTLRFDFIEPYFFRQGVYLNDQTDITRWLQLNSSTHGQSKSIDPWLGKDKLDHLLASAFIAGMSYMFFRDGQNISDEKAMIWSAGVSISIGIAKEIRDKISKKGMASFKDLLWDLLGVGIGILIYSEKFS